MLNRRESTILVGTKPDLGASYTVTAYPVGAVVRTTQTSATINVDAGHSMVAGDKILIRPGSDNVFSGTDTVQSVTPTTIVMGQSYAVSVADSIVNLGPDTGVATPNYDGSPMKTFSDADGSTTISSARVTASSLGEFSYYHRGDGRFWELVRNGSGTVVDVVKGHSTFQGRVNVCDYGAAADDATDDKARIQSAINAASQIGASSNQGGIAFFPAASYRISNSLLLPRSGATPVNAVHLIGENQNSTYIRCTNAFPVSTGMVQWAVSATTCRRNGIKRISFELPSVSGVTAVKFTPTLNSSLAEIIAETFEIHMEDVLIQGSNQYHSYLIQIGGNAKGCSFVNVVGDATLNTHAQDIFLFKFDTTPHAFIGLDYAGMNLSYFENIFCGFRAGGLVGFVQGRINQCVFNRCICGQSNRSLEYLDLTNAAACHFNGFTTEGGGGQPQISMSNCHHMHFTNLQLGSPSDQGSGVGNGIELVNSSDNFFHSRASYSGAASWALVAKKFATLDADSDRNTFLALGLNASFASEFTDSGDFNVIEMYDHSAGAYYFGGTKIQGTTFVDGRLGVGVSAPASEIDITGSGSATSVTIRNTASDGDCSTVYNLPATQFWSSGIDDSDGDKFKICPSNVLGTSTVMAMDTSGRTSLGTDTPDTTAVLTLSSTTRGFLPPKMTSTQRDAISSPTVGLTIFNTTTDRLEVRADNGGSPRWEDMAGNAA